MSVMTGLHLHHTGGAYTANSIDLNSYHRLTQGDGSIVSGKWSILDNAAGRIRKGQYAAHTLNANTGKIGLAMCAMGQGEWRDPRSCRFFPVKDQVDAFIREAARLCIEWGIPVTRKTVLTHAEIQITLGIKQNEKWDFDYDPYGILDSRDPHVIGDMLRAKILAEIAIMTGSPSQPVVVRPAPKISMPLVRQGSSGEPVRVLQAALNVGVDGAFGPKTRAAVIAFQRKHQLTPDGVVGPATWAEILRK